MAAAPPPPPTELPPSYEEALQHRTLEYDASAYPQDTYGGYLPSSAGGTPRGQLGSARPRSRAGDLSDRCMQLTLPPMHMGMAIVCFVFNILVPGFGTLLAAFGVFCCSNPEEFPWSRKVASCTLNIFVAIAQLGLTPLLLLGWIWSVFWGFALIGTSHKDFHGNKEDDDEDMHSARGHANFGYAPPYSAYGNPVPPPSYRSAVDVRGSGESRPPAQDSSTSGTLIVTQPIVHMDSSNPASDSQIEPQDLPPQPPPPQSQRPGSAARSGLRGLSRPIRSGLRSATRAADKRITRQTSITSISSITRPHSSAGLADVES